MALCLVVLYGLRPLSLPQYYVPRQDTVSHQARDFHLPPQRSGPTTAYGMHWGSVCFQPWSTTLGTNKGAVSLVDQDICLDGYDEYYGEKVLEKQELLLSVWSRTKHGISNTPPIPHHLWRLKIHPCYDQSSYKSALKKSRQDVSEHKFTKLFCFIVYGFHNIAVVSFSQIW